MWQSTKTIVRDIREMQQFTVQTLERLQEIQVERYKVLCEELLKISKRLCEQEEKQELFQRECLKRFDDITQLVGNIGRNTSETIYNCISELKRDMDYKVQNVKEEFTDFSQSNNSNISDVKEKTIDIFKLLSDEKQIIVANDIQQRNEMQMGIETVCKQVEVLKREIQIHNGAVDNNTNEIVAFIKEISESISLLDEGTRVIIANMLLGEIGE